MADCRQPPAALDNLVAELTAEPQPLRRRQILLAARDCWSPETVTRLYDEMIRLVRIDLGQADRLARAAAWIGEQMQATITRGPPAPAPWATSPSCAANTNRPANTTRQRSAFTSVWARNWRSGAP